MESGAGNAPGFQERGDAVACHDENKRNENRQAYWAESGRIAGNLPARRCRNYEKNKANYLMPERMNRLYGRGKNVLDKLSRLFREGLTGHEFILSKI
jgi:hypothetical protein